MMVVSEVGMKKPSTTISMLLRELSVATDMKEREVEALRATIAQLRRERECLLSELSFALAAANRETRAAASLRAELLARTSVAHERHDYCGDGHETTGVLPMPRPSRQRPARDDDATERCIRSIG
jgi:hypothetical protein